MTTGTDLSKRYAMLNFDRLKLCIPQVEVLNIELASSLQQSNTMERLALGYLKQGDIEVPVYSMTEDLCPAALMTNKYRNCIAFHIDGHPLFALACDSVEPLECDESTLIQPLPEPMITDNSPVRGLIILKDKLMFTSDAQAVFDYIGITEFIGDGDCSAQLN